MLNKILLTTALCGVLAGLAAAQRMSRLVVEDLGPVGPGSKFVGMADNGDVLTTNPRIGQAPATATIHKVDGSTIDIKASQLHTVYKNCDLRPALFSTNGVVAGTIYNPETNQEFGFIFNRASSGVKRVFSEGVKPVAITNDYLIVHDFNALRMDGKPALQLIDTQGNQVTLTEIYQTNAQPRPAVYTGELFPETSVNRWFNTQVANGVRTFTPVQGNRVISNPYEVFTAPESFKPVVIQPHSRRVAGSQNGKMAWLEGQTGEIHKAQTNGTLNDMASDYAIGTSNAGKGVIWKFASKNEQPVPINQHLVPNSLYRITAAHSIANNDKMFIAGEATKTADGTLRIVRLRPAF